MHGHYAARDELSVLPDGKVPRLDPNQVVEGELHDQATFRANLLPHCHLLDSFGKTKKTSAETYTFVTRKLNQVMNVN